MKRIFAFSILLFLLAPRLALAADNISITQGSGTTLATKDIGGGVEAAKNFLIDGSGNGCVATNAATVAGCSLQMGAEGSGKTNPLISCDKHKFVNISSATDTLLVQGVTSQVVYICGYTMFAGGTNTLYLENTASVNANCSSTLTEITGAVALTAQNGIVDKSPFYSGLNNTSGNGLCANSNGSGAVGVDLYYTQF